MDFREIKSFYAFEGPNNILPEDDKFGEILQIDEALDNFDSVQEAIDNVEDVLFTCFIQHRASWHSFGFYR